MLGDPQVQLIMLGRDSSSTRRLPVCSYQMVSRQSIMLEFSETGSRTTNINRPIIHHACFIYKGLGVVVMRKQQ
jgi:hypothetical protein